MSALAINGGKAVRTKPFSKWPVFTEQDERAVIDVVRSRVWGIDGSEVPAFERMFAQYQQAKYALCVANGTAALIVALKAAGIAPGDEVIMPAYTFFSTASSVLEVNAIPVFVDIEPESYCIDVSKIEGAITEKTKAIIPVHIAGHPADMDRVMEIADCHKLTVIEDAAQAHGAEWRGRRVGAIGHMGCFSFQSSKNLTCGEGGIILTDNRELADKCYSYRNCGRMRDGAWYEHHVLGQNYRMGEFQAAILSAQIQRLDEQIYRRNENGKYLSNKLSEIEGMSPLECDPRVTQHGYHLYIIRYDSEHFAGVSKGRFLEALNAEGIPCTSGYIPLYNTAFFKEWANSRVATHLPGTEDYSKDSCPNTEKACYDEAIWLEQAMLLGDTDDMDDILTAVTKIKELSGKLK